MSSEYFQDVIVPTIGIFLLVLLSIFGLCVMHKVGHREGYKDGQIDAMNGKVEYVLVEFEDGTRDYYKKSELPDLEDHKIITP